MRDQSGNYCYDGVRTWLKSANVANFDKIWFPINIGNLHWALTVIDVSCRRILCYDSLNDNYTWMEMKIFNNWLQSEFDATSQEFECFEVVNMKCPQQRNGSTSGGYD